MGHVTSVMSRMVCRQLIAVVLLAAGCASVPGPAPRPGSLATGSARWAYAIAQPSIGAFAQDAQLHAIIGAQVYRDGRLPSNAGDCSFVAWSPGLRQAFQVTVKFVGSSSTMTRSANTAPSQNAQPLAHSWADSTTFFAAAAPYLVGGVRNACLAKLNLASYAEAPSQSVWGLNFDAGQNQLVKWDGAYVGAQGAPNAPCAANLKSDFLKSEACANLVASGTAYDMDDPAWLINVSDQNRETCAYKFFSGFNMLGYNTMAGNPSLQKPQVAVLQQFQNQRGLPVSTLVTVDGLGQLDSLLVPREIKIAAVAATFPLYGRMQPLHRNDVSKNWVAYIYMLPMSVLPAHLRMGDVETTQCIWGQCLGFLQDANGVDLPCQQGGCYTTDLTVDYRFAGAYFDPRRNHAALPSAAADVGAVLHEHAHYLDAALGSTYPPNPLLGSVATSGFYDISYDMSQAQGACAPRRSTNPQDWITRYGFAGVPGGCMQGKVFIAEEWAEAFSMYVAAGRNFRAAKRRHCAEVQLAEDERVPEHRIRYASPARRRERLQRRSQIGRAHV